MIIAGDMICLVVGKPGLGWGEELSEKGSHVQRISLCAVDINFNQLLYVNL